MDGLSVTQLGILIGQISRALKRTTDPAARLAMNQASDLIADAASEGIRTLKSLDDVGDGLPSREPTPC